MKPGTTASNAFRRIGPALLVCKLCFLIERGFDDAAHKQAEDFAVKDVFLPEYLIADVLAIVRQNVNTAKTNGQSYDLLSDIENLLLARSASRTQL